MNCPSCQKSLLDDAHFCSHCGLSTRRFNTRTQIVDQQETVPYLHSEDPLLGRILDSKYELVERLGEGAMGAVYRAHRRHIGDDVAVKLLHPDLLLDEQAVERFRREARSAAMINHPNVVSIHDFSDGRVAGEPAYIVMELVKGESLRSRLRRAGRMTAPQAVALMRDICAGVGIAHRQGLLHRDLKPDNVIVQPALHEGESETAKVVDFGLAKLRDSTGASALTQTGTVIGTLYYMSPEQCSGEELDARADVYSLGAMFFETLTGAPPFQANNFVGLIAKHLHEQPPPFPESLRIPAALAAVCYRALSKNKDHRQPDALAFSRELQAAVSEPASSAAGTAPSLETLPAAPPVIGASPRRRTNPMKWVIGIAAVLAIIAIAGAALAIRYGAVDLPLLSSRNLNQPAKTNERQLPASGQSENANAAQPASATPAKSEASPTEAKVADLKGTWTGTYGPFSQPARLIVKSQKADKFEGVLEQGSIRVAFSGSLSGSAVRMKQSAVLSGTANSWALGEDTGTLSTNGKQLSGTGKDPVGGMVGITYEWTFSRP